MMQQHRCGEEIGYFGVDDEFGALDASTPRTLRLTCSATRARTKASAALDDRIEKLQAKLYKKQAAALRGGPGRGVQRRLNRQIERISDKLGKLTAKANRKAARKGEPIPYAAAAAGGRWPRRGRRRWLRAGEPGVKTRGAVRSTEMTCSSTTSTATPCLCPAWATSPTGMCKGALRRNAARQA
jgi:hypothetical protein